MRINVERCSNLCPICTELTRHTRISIHTSLYHVLVDGAMLTADRDLLVSFKQINPHIPKAVFHLKSSSISKVALSAALI